MQKLRRKDRVDVIRLSQLHGIDARNVETRQPALCGPSWLRRPRTYQQLSDDLGQQRALADAGQAAHIQSGAYATPQALLNVPGEHRPLLGAAR